MQIFFQFFFGRWLLWKGSRRGAERKRNGAKEGEQKGSGRRAEGERKLSIMNDEFVVFSKRIMWGGEQCHNRPWNWSSDQCWPMRGLKIIFMWQGQSYTHTHIAITRLTRPRGPSQWKTDLKYLGLLAIISTPGRSQGLLYKQLCYWLIHWFSDPLVKISLQRRQAHLVKNGASSHKTNYFDMSSEILDPEGYQNCCIGSKVMAILRNGWILPTGGVALGRVCVCSLRSRLV